MSLPGKEFLGTVDFVVRLVLPMVTKELLRSRYLI